MEPWYRVATPRKQVREGRSFNPDEFAIAINQVVARMAPEDYRDPRSSALDPAPLFDDQLIVKQPELFEALG